ncbi:hypothetical protein J6590_012511 [Homalodisca vitripennis]|nr:hypothetical protein J6590_012511 [Homalodisca vitripennis]
MEVHVDQLSANLISPQALHQTTRHITPNCYSPHLLTGFIALLLLTVFTAAELRVHLLCRNLFNHCHLTITHNSQSSSTTQQKRSVTTEQKPSIHRNQSAKNSCLVRARNCSSLLMRASAGSGRQGRWVRVTRLTSAVDRHYRTAPPVYSGFKGDCLCSLFSTHPYKTAPTPASPPSPSIPLNF